MSVTSTMPVWAKPRNATSGLPVRSSASEKGAVMSASLPTMPPAESEVPSGVHVVLVAVRRWISVLPLASSLSQATFITPVDEIRICGA